MNDTPRTDEFIGEHSEWSPAPRKNWPLFACQLERELNAANAEIQSLKYNIDRVMGMYSAKDNQICNMLNICRDNDIEVSSYDLIHGKEDKL